MGAMTARHVPAPTSWRNRIVGHGEEAPNQLLANPASWRTHRKAQRAALVGSLDSVGWVAQVMVNRTTGTWSTDMPGSRRQWAAASRRCP
jgi:hypothetical protein